jgi:hypothetical protein
MSHFLWAPPLPSNGRSGPRITVDDPNLADSVKLEKFYLGTKYQGGLTRWAKLPRRLLRRCGLNHRKLPKAFAEYSQDERAALFLKNLYFKASANLVRRVKTATTATLQRWLDTADGVVLPYLLEAEKYDDQVINRLTRFALESCANNYAQFIGRLKRVKKLIRKGLALDEPTPFFRDMSPYLHYYRVTAPGEPSSFPCPPSVMHSHAVHCQLWCQTRAVGLADGIMAERALQKFYATVTEPDAVDDLFLEKVAPHIRESTLSVRSARGVTAHLSMGPKASLDKTQSMGGHTARLIELVRTERVHYRYNLETLERTWEPRRIKSSGDVLDFCIEWVLSNPLKRRIVRAHAVLEPSKARIITLAPWCSSRIMGVVSHILAPCLRQAFQTKSGMTKDRHLWRFFKNLHPQDVNWKECLGRPVLSTDWSEATDYFSHRFAKRIWESICRHLKKVPGAPLGLIRLAATLHTEFRILLKECDPDEAPGDHEAHYRIADLVITRRGLFMGDYLTKVILTYAQDICARAAKLKVYSIVGDDLIAFGDRANLELYLLMVEKLGNRISWDDTFVSERLMYYCEEIALVPWETKHLPVVQYKRGESKMHYVDCPRIRLLLPVTKETLGFSDVAIGKFSLLGKESRWVCSTHRALKELFHRASLYQHILLRQDRDTQCPYLPMEIGGDGAFSEDPKFVQEVIRTKSRDPDETAWRTSALFRGREGHRLVRSDTLNQVTHRYVARLPVLKKLREFLPEELVIPIDESNSSLRSLQLRGFLEDPEQTIFRMVKEAYYRACLHGKGLNELPSNPFQAIEKEFSGPRSQTPYLPMKAFLEHWKNPGFSFRNEAEYLVRADLAPMVDHLNLGLRFGLDRPVTASAEFREWLSQSGCLQDLDGEDLITHLVGKEDLPRRIQDRLHMYVESDAVVKERFVRNPPPAGKILLVSTDLRLGADLVRLGAGRGTEYQVFCLQPAFYLFGRLDELPELSEASVVEDPGSMFYEDVVHFSEGDPPEWIWDPLFTSRTRHQSVMVVDRHERKFRGRYTTSSY